MLVVFSAGVGWQVAAWFVRIEGNAEGRVRALWVAVVVGLGTGGGVRGRSVVIRT